MICQQSLSFGSEKECRVKQQEKETLISMNNWEKN
jgi:hypothetical protein